MRAQERQVDFGTIQGNDEPFASLLIFRKSLGGDRLAVLCKHRRTGNTYLLDSRNPAWHACLVKGLHVAHHLFQLFLLLLDHGHLPSSRAAEMPLRLCWP